ncbi:hypothetical protein QYE76_064401 [Lolium multiflorum]|uniref:PB1 domain-containing protein n=1 Tax=Lolium multiflorum TaxID=4521 RepID=A0AAD8S6D3_LOLMU|nr:hypothetical protein QYE76_064401 [Lolium multiflorum]
MDAPMSSSLGAMGPLLRKLDSLLAPDYRLPKLLKDRIQLLKADLEEISDALLEQSMVDSPNEMAKYWMNEVRELCYDIEDFIDNMMFTHADAKMRSVQSYKVGRVKIASFPKMLKPCTRAAKVAELSTLVREASERHDRYFDGCTSSSSRREFTGHGRIPALYAEAANLVGIDDSKAKLIKWLTDEEEQQLKVVAIVGPAGVGKTTLAKQVYHELGEQFECRAFVRASRKPDMRRLLGGILSQVQGGRRSTDSCTVQNIIDNLTEHLQDKSAFPEGTNHSRTIITAKIEGVALECCDYQSKNILKMKPLGREDSRELLFSLVFGSEHLCPELLNSVLDIIVTKCAGLPLAIICVAGLLTIQPGNTELWQHLQECLCSNLSTNSTLEETLQEVVKLSYDSLPHYLKTCLMYLSMFPEGYKMWKVDLVKLWIAEGFIGAREGKEICEVADSCFGELVNRGMIQPMDINYNAEVLSCTLHHVVLDLITLESNEENFITALDYSQTITGFYSKAHRLSLHFSNTRYAKKPTGPTLSKVRSIGFFGILECVPSVVEFKLLRVLILEFWGERQGSTRFNLTRISRLVQLRYLKISCDASVVFELPAKMRMLRYLETLIIDAVVSAVPLDIIHLPGLWHLFLGVNIDIPDGIGCIRSLRTLHYFDVCSNSEDNILSLGDLINLQDLHLTYYKESDEHLTEESDEHLKRNLRALASSLVKLVNLKSVTLAAAAAASDTTIYLDVRSSISFPSVNLQRLELLPPICLFSRLPEWIGQLQKLCFLEIVVSQLLMKDMDMLTGLPALTILKLYVRQPTEGSIIFKRGAFLGLKYFKYTCGVLPLTFQEEAFLSLQRLELSFNAHRGVQYDHFLPGIDYLLNLKEIAGTIGAAVGAEEPDRRVAESAFKDAIRKHPRFPSYDNVKRVDRVCEEYQLRTQEEDSSSEKHEILQKECRRKEGDSSVDRFRIVLKENQDDTMQHSDWISHFPARGSIISPDQTKKVWSRNMVGGGGLGGGGRGYWRTLLGLKRAFALSTQQKIPKDLPECGPDNNQSKPISRPHRMGSAPRGGPGPGYYDSTDSSTALDSTDSSRSRDGDSRDEPFTSSAATAAAGGGGRLRLMCSFGGRIVPRPTGKSVCYLGGETRIVAVDRNATLADVHAQLSRLLLACQPFKLKYKLPNEDLNSLISVSTDEDLDNLFEEYDRVTATSSRTSRIRLFLFPAKPESSSSLIGDSPKSENWFVNTLNRAISSSIHGTPCGISIDSASVNLPLPDVMGCRPQPRQGPIPAMSGSWMPREVPPTAEPPRAMYYNDTSPRNDMKRGMLVGTDAVSYRTPAQAPQKIVTLGNQHFIFNPATGTFIPTQSYYHQPVLQAAPQHVFDPNTGMYYIPMRPNAPQRYSMPPPRAQVFYSQAGAPPASLPPQYNPMGSPDTSQADLNQNRDS